MSRRKRSAVRYTQFLIFEIGRECCLAGEHAGKCPSGDVDRYGLLPTGAPTSDDQILDAVEWAWEAGFRGHIGWHYYNEPLLFWGRIRSLVQRIRERVPGAEFVLWTSGVPIGRRVPPAELSVFSRVWISDYHRRTTEWKELRRHVSEVIVLDGALDERKRIPGRAHNPHCLRPFHEFIVDYYGNGHLCCADWRGDVHIGSIHTDGFPAMFARFSALRETLMAPDGHPNAPALCRICRLNAAGVYPLVPAVAELAMREKRIRPHCGDAAPRY